ncbi:MAG: hypothetical protein Q7S28_00055 [bacterium]|nr:hypothetical protein [bacterium]
MENPEKMGKLLSFEDGKERMKKVKEGLEDKAFQTLESLNRRNALQCQILSEAIDALKVETDKQKIEHLNEVIADAHDMIQAIEKEADDMRAVKKEDANRNEISGGNLDPMEAEDRVIEMRKRTGDYDYGS